MRWPWKKGDSDATLVDECVGSYWSRLSAGRGRGAALRGILEDQFSSDPGHVEELWERFRSKDFGDTDLDEAKQMIMLVVGEKRGWASSLAGVGRLGGLIDQAFQ